MKAKTYDILEKMEDKGLSITEAIKAVRILEQTSLGRAKELVTSHPAWSRIVEANEPLHDTLEEMIRGE